MKNIVFLSYGGELEYKRAVFSLLSLISLSSEKVNTYRIIIYTDNPEYFIPIISNLGVQIVYKTLTFSSLESMIGDTGYSHRRKLFVITEVSKEFPSVDLLFIDSDTFWVKDPKSLLARIEQGQIHMHKREYTFVEGIGIYRKYMQDRFESAEQFPKAFIRQLESQTFLLKLEEVKFDENNYCWNSGLVGIPTTFLSYLPDILKINDKFYGFTNWFISEQLAFSCVFQHLSTIQSAEDEVIHYWREKGLIDSIINTTITRIRNRANFRKLAIVRSSVRTATKIILFNTYLDIFTSAIRKRNLKVALKNGASAAKQLNLDKQFLKYLSGRVAKKVC